MSKPEELIVSLKVYTVVETNFDYNDGISYASGGGTPVLGYLDFSKATAEATRLSRLAFRGENLTEFGYGINDVVIDPDPFWKILKKYNITEDIIDETDDLRITSNITDEDLDELMDCTSLGFYYVVEIDMKDLV